MPRLRDANLKRLLIEVTNGCNLRCTYCFEGHAARLDSPKWSAIQQAADALCESAESSDRLRIDFWGGEPLLALGLIKRTVTHVRTQAARLSLEVVFGICTNSTLLDPKVVDYLTSNNFRTTVSIDGTQASHDKHRITATGRGTYDRAQRHLPLLLEQLPRTMASMTVTPETAHAFEENVAHLVEMGFRDISFDIQREVPWTRDQWEAFLVGVEVLIEQWIAWIDEGRQVRVDPITGLMEAIVQPRLACCHAAKSFVCLGTDGFLYPCHHISGRPDTRKGMCLGTVDEPDEEVWERFGAARDASWRRGGRDCPGRQMGVCSDFVPGEADTSEFLDRIDRACRAAHQRHWRRYSLPYMEYFLGLVKPQGDDSGLDAWWQAVV